MTSVTENSFSFNVKEQKIVLSAKTNELLTSFSHFPFQPPKEQKV